MIKTTTAAPDIHNADALPMWLTIDAAAEFAGSSASTIRRMIANGELSASKFGKRAIRIDTASLLAAFKPIPTRTRHHGDAS